MPASRLFRLIGGRYGIQRGATDRTHVDCVRYRVTAKTGHTKVAFDAIRLSANTSKSADYFERCRRKRNVIDYTRSHVATEVWGQVMTAKSPSAASFKRVGATNAEAPYLRPRLSRDEMRLLS